MLGIKFYYHSEALHFLAFHFTVDTQYCGHTPLRWRLWAVGLDARRSRGGFTIFAFQTKDTRRWVGGLDTRHAIHGKPPSTTVVRLPEVVSPIT